MYSRSPLVAMCFAVIIMSLAPRLHAQISGDFTYQGELRENGQLTDGNVAAEFRLYDAPAGGAQIGLTNTINPLNVVDGRFTVTLDFFVNAFNDVETFLEIEIDGVTLAPRQPVTPAPQSLWSNNTRGLTVNSIGAVAVGTTTTTHRFQAYTSDHVRAIYGNNLNTNPGTTYGVYGRAVGTGGIGVYGVHASPLGTAPGVFGETDSTDGGALGVHGVVNSSGAGSFSAGVRGENQGTGVTGIGVWGSHDGQGWGVYGTSTGGLGRAIYGEITGSGGVAGYFLNDTGVALLADGADNNGSLAALQIVSGSQTMLIDGNEIDSNSTAGLHLNNNSPEDVFFVMGGGKVGVGTTTIGGFEKMRIEASGTNVPLGCKKTGDGSIIDFYQGNTLAGAISFAGNVVIYNDFTGAHLGQSTTPMPIGSLVRMTGDNSWLEPNRTSEIIYGVEVTRAANDPACLGVYVGQQSGGDSNGDERLLVAAVGNGEMWVARGSETSVQPGDFLVSSDVPGCAMVDDPRQFEVGYVIARAAEPVEWSRVEADASGVKRIKISVLFESFVRDSRGADLAETVQAQQTQIDSLKDELAQMREMMESMRSEQRAASVQ